MIKLLVITMISVLAVLVLTPLTILVEAVLWIKGWVKW